MMGMTVFVVKITWATRLSVGNTVYACMAAVHVLMGIPDTHAKLIGAPPTGTTLAKNASAMLDSMDHDVRSTIAMA